MAKIPSFDAFIFDMDGVLVNSESFYSEMERICFQRLGLNIPHEEHVTYQGTATDEMWKILKEKYHIPHPVGELVEMNNALTVPVFRNLEKIPVMPGVTALLGKLEELGVPLALASSSFPEVIEIILQKSGLDRFFREVVHSRMVGKSKPAPDIFLLTAEKLKVHPAKCIVIEDSTNGIRAAKLAGMFCIAYNGPGAEHQDQSGADWQISDYREIMELL